MHNTKVVFITGATSGIGLALAIKYLNNHHKVIITGRTEKKVLKTSKMLKENFPNDFLEAATINVTNENTLKQYIQKCHKKYGITTVIANAGISLGVLNNANSFHNVGTNIFNTNVQGVFNTVHPFIKLFKQQGFGDILLVSSMSAFFGLSSAVFYSASKAAIKNYGEGLRALLKNDNIYVGTIFPGFIKSNITNSNTFKMPLLMSADSAATIIYNKHLKKKNFIIFPLRLYLITYIISILPFSIRAKLIDKLPNK